MMFWEGDVSVFRAPLLAALGLLPALAAGQGPVPSVNMPPFGAQIVWPNQPNLIPLLDRLQEGGIRWVRFDLAWWSIVEYAPGGYNFNPGDWQTDAALAAMKARNIEPIVILCYGHPSYDGQTGPSSAAGRKAFGDYAVAAAQRYKDSITYWEIWNEPNLEQFWGTTPNAENYARLVNEVAPRIRAADPSSRIIGGATSLIDNTYLESCFQVGMLDSVDIITIHPYRQSAPESINAEVQTLRDLIASHTTRKIDIWSGEWGYNSYWSNVTELGQGKLLARMMVNNLSQGIPMSVWFSTHAFEHDVGTGSATDPQFALIDYDNVRKRPSFYALSALTARLAAPVEAVADPYSTTITPAVSQQRIACFQRPGSSTTVLALWRATWPSRDRDAGVSTTIAFTPPAGSTLRAFSAMDDSEVPLTIADSGGRKQLTGFLLRDYPVLVEVTTPPADRRDEWRIN